MRVLTVRLALLLALAMACPPEALPQTRDRARVTAEDTWKLEDIYPSDAAWAEAKERLAGRLDEVLAFQGALAGAPENSWRAWIGTASLTRN